jgi:hypothetical protein
MSDSFKETELAIAAMHEADDAEMITALCAEDDSDQSIPTEISAVIAECDAEEREYRDLVNWGKPDGATGWESWPDGNGHKRMAWVRFNGDLLAPETTFVAWKVWHPDLHMAPGACERGECECGSVSLDERPARHET